MTIQTESKHSNLGRNWSRWALILIAVVGVAGAAHAQQQPPPGYLGPPQPIPTGPAAPSPPGAITPLAGPVLPNVLVNDKVGDAPNQSQSETSMGVDPTNPLRLVGGFNDCRGFFVPSRNGISGWGFSLDGGTTWTGVQTGLPKGAPGDFGARGDPSIDVDADGNFYYANLYSVAAGGGTPINVSVHKGKFVGTNFVWNPPTFATTFTSGFGADKVHIGVDKRPGSNTIYVSYTNFNAGGNGQVEVARSTDGGQTWSAAVVIATASGTVHQGSLPRVGPDGEVYVVWEDGFVQPTRSIHIRKSTTWPNFGSDITVSSVTPVANPPFNSRTNEFPTMDIDRSSGTNRGRVYVAWNDGRDGGPGAIGEILLSHSADGTTWSTPVRVNDDGLPSATGTHHWFAWVAVDLRGVANLGWYDRRLRGTQADLTDVFAAQFTVSGGVSPNQRLTSQSFSMNVPSACTPNFGDYNGAAAGTTRFHFIYGDGRLGNPDTFSAGVTTSPILANPSSAEACRPTPTTTTITVLGGQGLFQDNVALSLTAVSPAPPPGGEITADFNPNPVPAPPPAGNTSIMTINTTAATPPNSYILTVQGSDGTTSAATPVSLVVRSQAPDAPNLLTPPDGADGLVETPSFTWSAADQATAYRLQIFSSPDCSGDPLRDFDNISGTGFTVPQPQALPFFQTFSWRVTAKNSCGPTPSAQCFTFRTRSCVSTPHDAVANGGFEQGLTNWIVDASTPKPLVVPDQKHSGLNSLRLGVIGEPGTQTQPGASEVHQTITIPAAALATQLSFWVYEQSSDSVANDQQEAFIVPINPPGPPVSLMKEANNGRVFLNRTFDLASFIGKTIEIHFRVRNDGNDQPTGMFVDDVSVTFISCGGPDFLVTAAAPTFNEVCSGNSIGFSVGVQSLNGLNFVSPVMLSAANLPSGVTASFADNPILPGGTTTMTLATAQPSDSGRRFFSVIGTAVEGPPNDPRATTADTTIDNNPPGSPEEIAPLNGQVNVPRRPTLSWTEPFVPATPQTASTTNFFDLTLEQQVANAPPGGDPDGNLSAPASDPGITGFGAPRYHIQVSRDSGFGNPLVDTDTPDTVFTLPADLAAATQYFWHVNATNACGSSAFSAAGSFVTGACSEGWAVNPAVPITNGPSQPSVVAAAGKIYVIGGGVGPGPDTRINQVWEFDPATGNWTRKADVPTPGPGSNYGSAAEFGGKIYVFGGVMGPPGPITILQTLWIYNVAANSWSRGKDLPSANFGIAVGVIGTKIILATGSGFGNQTWQYDPASDTYTRLADAPAFQARMHATVANNELRAFAGGFNGTNHFIYNASTDTWRVGPQLPIGVTDPAVGFISGKIYVVAGRPTARTQIFDLTANTWSQGPPVPGLPTGLDNTSGAMLGSKLYVAGGFDGVNGSNAHRVFTVCGADSAQFVSFAVDGDGSLSGVSNERTSLILSNDRADSATSATVFFNTPDGSVDSSRTFSLAPKETKTLTHIIRQVRGADGVQNVKGSLAVLATQSIDAVAVVSNNTTNDPALADGQTLAGTRNGFVPRIALNDGFHTQVVFNNASSREANVQLLAYPPEGGDVPAASASVSLAPHGVLDFPDIVSALGLPAGFAGQLTWNSTQPVTVFARTATADGGSSGALPVHNVADGSNALLVAYVEDTAAFRTDLQLNNNGPFTADVAIQFIDVADPTGGTPGVSNGREIQVRVNSATSIANIIRWALGSDSGDPTGKRGFLVISSPQTITALATIVNAANSDPASIDAAAGIVKGFSPLIIRVEPLDPAPTVSSRVAIANPGTAAANVDLLPFNPNGTPALAAPVRVKVAGGGQLFTADIVGLLGLPPTFAGSLAVSSDAPVVVFNQELGADNNGAVIPVHSR